MVLVSFETDLTPWIIWLYVAVSTKLYLLTGLHDHGCAGDQISCLLTDLGRLVVQTPKHRTADLWQVGLHAFAQGIDDGAETI